MNVHIPVPHWGLKLHVCFAKTSERLLSWKSFFFQLKNVCIFPFPVRFRLGDLTLFGLHSIFHLASHILRWCLAFWLTTLQKSTQCRTDALLKYIFWNKCLWRPQERLSSWRYLMSIKLCNCVSGAGYLFTFFAAHASPKEKVGGQQNVTSYAD